MWKRKIFIDKIWWIFLISILDCPNCGKPFNPIYEKCIFCGFIPTIQETLPNKLGKGFKKISKTIQLSGKKLKTKWDNFTEKHKKNSPFYLKLKKLSEKHENLENALRKLESLSTDTHQLASEIKEDTEQIKVDINVLIEILEGLTENINDLEDHMRTHLGTQWQKIKYSWEQYKSGKLTKKEFFKYSLMTLGKKFVGIFT